MVKYKKQKEDGSMIVWVGAACFVLGANFGFVVAGLLHAAKREEQQPLKKETKKPPKP